MASTTKHTGPHDDCEIDELHEHPVDGNGPITIPLGESDKFFYGGVSAGSHASEQLEQIADATFTEKVSYFWLKVGTELGAKFPGASQEQADLFIRGAGLRKPEERPVAFRLDITDTDNAAFHPDEDTYDEQYTAAEIARILREAADKLEHEGEYEYPLHDLNGNKVGQYEFKTDH